MNISFNIEIWWVIRYAGFKSPELGGEYYLDEKPSIHLLHLNSMKFWCQKVQLQSKLKVFYSSRLRLIVHKDIHKYVEKDRGKGSAYDKTSVYDQIHVGVNRT